MAAKQHTQKAIQVCAHWHGMDEPVLMGTLYATPSRGKEYFPTATELQFKVGA
jgi:serine/threonine-protein kinase HipA